jgi:hypothetical protein
MTNRSDLIREVKSALTRALEKSPSGRYAVYLPGAVVIGTYTRKAEARAVATRWTAVVPDVVIVDRGAAARPGMRGE